MVEIIEVEDWDKITRSGNYPTHGLFYIRVKEPETISKIVEVYNIQFLFKKGKEFLCNAGNLIYWHKP